MQTGRHGKEGLRSSLMLLRDQSDERRDRADAGIATAYKLANSAPIENVQRPEKLTGGSLTTDPLVSRRSRSPLRFFLSLLNARRLLAQVLSIVGHVVDPKWIG